MTSIRSAGTVVLLRDLGGEQQVLLLRRNSRVGFAGGAWVFPGGAVDAVEQEGRDEIDAARLAAVRECREEAGLLLPGSELVFFAHWLTPEGSPKRYSTWFFLHQSIGEVDVRVDGSEIIEYRWASPEALLVEHREGNLPLMPPTYVTLVQLNAQRSAEASLAFFRQRPAEYFLPRMEVRDNGVIFLYQQDVAYGGGDPDVDGDRHRCTMDERGCRYENSID